MASRRWWKRRWLWSLRNRVRALASGNSSCRQTLKTTRHLQSLREECAKSWPPVLVSFLAQGVQDDDAADGETADGSERSDQHEIGAGVEQVGGDRAEREYESQHVERERGADARADVFAKTKFQQESGESDGCHHDQRQRAEERGAAGVD